MPPVISKPTSQTELSQVLNKDKVDEYAPSSVDSNLAHIIMKVVKRLKSSTIGKKKKRKCRFPCSVCSKNVKANAIKCNNCHHWSHAVCNGISKSEYEILVGEDESVPWYCLPCTIKVSHYLLPYILHPTRVTDPSATIIDNIFSNVCEFETISGNIMVQLADYFAQFFNHEQDKRSIQKLFLSAT